MIKLNNKFFIYKNWVQPYPHENFSAIIFFDFFLKGKKIISFPLSYLISPWGLNVTTRETLEEEELFKEEEYSEIKYFKVKNQYFYLTIFLTSQGKPKHIQFLNWFEYFLGKETFFKKKIKGNFWINYTIKNPAFFPFEKLMREQVYEPVIYHVEKSILELLSFVEQEVGPIEKLETTQGNWEISTDLIDKIGLSGRNFCLNTPPRIKINLEEHLSFKELTILLEEIEKLGYGENPFGGEIETSIEEYKEFLLTIFSQGKLSYTNLEIEKLDLSIEELFVLFFFIKEHYARLFIRGSVLPLSFYEEISYFLPEENSHLKKDFPYRYFWFKVKEALRNIVK